MKALKILSAQPALFFRLSGIRLTDFNALVADTSSDLVEK